MSAYLVSSMNVCPVVATQLHNVLAWRCQSATVCFSGVHQDISHRTWWIGVAAGGGAMSHGRTSHVSRAQVCVWQTAPDLTDAHRPHAERAGGTDWRASAQRAELGGRRVLP